MLAVTILNERQHEQRLFADGFFRLGKGSDQHANSTQFLVVSDPLVDDQQLEIQLLDNAEHPSIEISNVGSSSLALSSGRRIHRGTKACLELPTTFSVGDTHVQIFANEEFEHVDASTVSLPRVGFEGSPGDHDSEKKLPSPAADTLAAWLEMLSELQQVVAGSSELYKLAARAVFNPGGLDGGMILLPGSDGWEIAASHIPYPDNGIGFREDLVCHAVKTKETIYHQPKSPDDDTFNELHSAVVCPVIGADDQVLAAVYGFRSTHRLNSRRGIRVLEAQFVKVVADSLSAAMIRLEAEAEAARSMVLLNQAFSPNIARQLQANPDFLRPQSCEVTCLFADLRGFSEISEDIGSRYTYELLSQLMERLTNAVTDHDGVVIDYYGDGISAFWNAPIYQPQHALFACQAGLEMLNCLPELSEAWQDRIGRELNIGIGIHTGDAHIGNSGSRSRLKYGPRGTTVNLASRMEATTKQIGIPLVISGTNRKVCWRYLCNSPDCEIIAQRDKGAD